MTREEYEALRRGGMVGERGDYPGDFSAGLGGGYAFARPDLAFAYEDAVEAGDKERQRGIVAHSEDIRNTQKRDQDLTNTLLSIMQGGLAAASPAPGAYGALGPQLAQGGQAGIGAYLGLERQSLLRDQEERLTQQAHTRAAQGAQRLQQAQVRLNKPKGDWVMLPSGETRLMRTYPDGRVTYAVSPDGEEVSQPRSPQIMAGEDQYYIVPPGSVAPGPPATGASQQAFPGVGTGVRPAGVVARKVIRDTPEGPVAVDPESSVADPVHDRGGRRLPPPPKKPGQLPYVGTDPFFAYRSKDSYVAAPESGTPELGSALAQADAEVARLGGVRNVPADVIERIKRDLRDQQRANKGWNDPDNIRKRWLNQTLMSGKDPFSDAAAVRPPGAPAGPAPIAYPPPAVAAPPAPFPGPADALPAPSAPLPQASPVPEQNLGDGYAAFATAIKNEGLTTADKMIAYLTTRAGFSSDEARIFLARFRGWAAQNSGK